MASTSIFDFTDFSGGYFTDVPTDRMKDNELLTAENCYWRNGLKKRGGKASYCSFTASNLRGGIRAKIANAWYTILGVEPTAGNVELRIGTDTAFTTLTRYDAASQTFTAYTLTTGYNVQFAVLDEKVVAVNGYDKPSIIYSSLTTTANFIADTLERYDTREMDHDDWYAGQYYPSLTATTYLTDTTDAQSSASADFLLASYSITSGFWVACAHTFNKVTLYDCKANATGSFTSEYYGRASTAGATGWIGFTPLVVPTWTAVGDKIIEADFPIDSLTNEILMEKTASLNSSIGGVYSMRFTNGTFLESITAWACGEVKLEHTQYLTQILLGDKPDTVKAHKSHMVLGSGNWMRISPYGTLRGWREQDKEYFSEGGLIQAMEPHLDYLAIILDNAIYGLYGNSWSNWSTKLLNGTKGTIAKRSVAVVNEEIYFAARDGIYGWNGTRLLKLSKHIKADYGTYTITDAAAANINGEYWISFPTNSITLVFDPDSIRMDDVGDGRVSFYKFNTYQVHQFLPYTGANDTGYLYAIVNGTNIRLDKLETNNFDKITASSTIPMVMRSRDMAFGNSQQNKVFRRLKMQLAQVSLTGGGVYTIKHYANNIAGSQTASTFFTAATGTGIDTAMLGIPPGIDGFTYGIYVAHDSQCDAKLLGYSVEMEKRKY